METPFRILCVCRANIARSYLAQSFLRHALRREGVDNQAVDVVSRGTQVSQREMVPPDITNIVARLDGGANVHVPTQVSVLDLESADLVLVAEKSMEEALVDLAPASSDYTFSIIEFGRLVSDSSVQAALPVTLSEKQVARGKSLATKVRTLGQYRGYLAFSDDSEDIDDPAGKTREHLVATAQTIEKWSSHIARWCAER